MSGGLGAAAGISVLGPVVDGVGACGSDGAEGKPTRVEDDAGGADRGRGGPCSVEDEPACPVCPGSVGELDGGGGDPSSIVPDEPRPAGGAPDSDVAGRWARWVRPETGSARPSTCSRVRSL